MENESEVLIRCAIGMSMFENGDNALQPWSEYWEKMDSNQKAHYINRAANLAVQAKESGDEDLDDDDFYSLNSDFYDN